MSPISPHPPAPSPSGRGDEKRFELEPDQDATYRVMASRAMVQVARELRQRETDAEVILWETLRDRRLANLKFRRQHPIATTAFVADFLCYAHRIIIEIDGEIHESQIEQDRLRQQAIEDTGYRVLRFSNGQVLRQLEDVLVAILSACSHSPLALRERGRG